jgi:hypothetical protein
MDSIENKNENLQEQQVRYIDNVDEIKKAAEIKCNKIVKIKNEKCESFTEPRTYAKMIADFVVEIENKRLEASSKNLNKDIFSKLSFDTVISTFTKLDRMKIRRAALVSSNNLTSFVNRLPNDSRHALTDNIIKNEKMKMIAKIKKDSQKRKYFTKNNESVALSKPVEESTALMNISIETREKQLESGKATNYVILANELEKNFHLIYDNDDKRLGKNNDRIDDQKSLNTIDIRFKKPHILNSKDKIEIEVPISMDIINENNLYKKTAVMSLEISAKLKEKSHPDKNSFNYIVKSTDMLNAPNNKIEDEAKKSFDSKKRNSQDSKHLPWWASKDSIIKNKRKQNLKSDMYLSDVYISNSDADSLFNDDLLPRIDRSEEFKSIKMISKQHPLFPRAVQALRRKRKGTTVSKVMRYMEEEIEERKNYMKANKTFVKLSSDESKIEIDTILEKSRDNNSLIQLGTNKEMNSSSGMAMISLMSGEGTNLKTSVKIKNKEAARLVDNLVQNENIENPSYNCTVGASDSIDSIDCEPNILLHNIIESKKEESNGMIEKKMENERKKNNLTDYEIKIDTISDIFKPIEKREDGTLIDYGLRVPTRKPKQKPPKKSPTIPVTSEKNIPKKAISDLQPQQEEQQLPDNISGNKLNVSLGISSEFPEKSNVLENSEIKSERLPSSCTENTNWVHQRLLNWSKHKYTIKKKVEENLTLAADNSREKAGNDTAAVKSDNEVGPFGKNNNSKGGKCMKMSRLPVNSRKNILKPLFSEQVLNAEVFTGPLKKIEDSDKLQLNTSYSKAALSICLDRPEKKLLYSSWLNRLHTQDDSNMKC